MKMFVHFVMELSWELSCEAYKIFRELMKAPKGFKALRTNKFTSR